jgi:hypothetical protein
MIKNFSRLEYKFNGKEHFYMCDADTSLAEVKEVLSHFFTYIGEVEDAAKAKILAKQDEAEIAKAE